MNILRTCLCITLLIPFLNNGANKKSEPLQESLERQESFELLERQESFELLKREESFELLEREESFELVDKKEIECPSQDIPEKISPEKK